MFCSTSLSCPVLSYRVLPCLLLSSSVLFGSVLPCALQSPILYSCVYNIELSSLLTLDLGPHSMLPQADLFSELRPVYLRAVCSRLETFFSERTVAGSMRGTRERYILEYKREVSHSTAQNRTEYYSTSHHSRADHIISLNYTEHTVGLLHFPAHIQPFSLDECHLVTLS
jgi:hypothetical protein